MSKDVPKLRFPEFTDSWEQRKLGELSDSFEYGLNAAATEYDGKNKYIRITDIDDESRRFVETDLTSPKIDLSYAGNYKLKIGDILFARTGASVGKSYIYNESDGLVYYAGFLIRTRIKPEYDAEFVFQSTLTSKYNDYIRINSQRSGQPGVNAQEYAEFSFLIPEPDEQFKIGTFFRNLDNLITLHQRKLEHLREQKTGLLQKMFPKDGADVPEIRFPEFTDPWEQRKLGEIAEIRRGLTYNPTNIREVGIRVLRSSNINEDRFVMGMDDVFVVEDAINIPFAKNGDILITSANGSSRLVGKHAIIRGIQEKSTVHGGFMLAASTKFPEFLNASMSSPWYSKFINLFVAGGNGAIGNLNRTDLDEQLVSIPTEEEQQQIGAFFQQLDNLITLHQRKLEHLREQKKALLQQMFI